MQWIYSREWQAAISPNDSDILTENIVVIVIVIVIIATQSGKVRPAVKLQVKAAKVLTLVGLARSKQDPFKLWARCSVFVPLSASRGQVQRA